VRMPLRGLMPRWQHMATDIHETPEMHTVNAVCRAALLALQAHDLSALLERFDNQPMAACVADHLSDAYVGLLAAIQTMGYPNP